VWCYDECDMRARRDGICKSVGFVSELQPCCIVCLSSVVFYSSWLKNGGEGIGSENGIVPYQVVFVITWHHLTPSNYRRDWHTRSQRVHVHVKKYIPPWAGTTHICSSLISTAMTHAQRSRPGCSGCCCISCYVLISYNYRKRTRPSISRPRSASRCQSWSSNMTHAFPSYTY
jgi:hypothetical protein